MARWYDTQGARAVSGQGLTGRPTSVYNAIGYENGRRVSHTFFSRANRDSRVRTERARERERGNAPMTRSQMYKAAREGGANATWARRAARDRVASTQRATIEKAIRMTNTGGITQPRSKRIVLPPNVKYDGTINIQRISPQSQKVTQGQVPSIGGGSSAAQKQGGGSGG